MSLAFDLSRASSTLWLPLLPHSLSLEVVVSDLIARSLSLSLPLPAAPPPPLKSFIANNQPRDTSPLCFLS